MTFWDKKRVLVTGGHGFLGSHVVSALRDKGAVVVSPTHKEYNLVDSKHIDNLYDEHPKLDLVIHLAARVGGIGGNVAHPAGYFYDNLVMGIQLLHKAYERGIPKFVAFGTVCSYPKNPPVPFKEEDLWNGYPEDATAPYGIAKKMMLVQSQTYRKEYGYNSIFLMPVNLYGPNDNFDKKNPHVVPALIKRCLGAARDNLEEIEVWGDGSATREFLYVEDAVEGILLAAEKYDKSDPVNLGSGKEISIKKLVNIITKETGYKGVIKWDKSKPSGQPRRMLDVSKAKKEFGFVAKTDFKTGLHKTVLWYKNSLSNQHKVRKSA